MYDVLCLHMIRDVHNMPACIQSFVAYLGIKYTVVYSAWERFCVTLGTFHGLN